MTKMIFGHISVPLCGPGKSVGRCLRSSEAQARGRRAEERTPPAQTASCRRELGFAQCSPRTEQEHRLPWRKEQSARAPSDSAGATDARKLLLTLHHAGHMAERSRRNLADGRVNGRARAGSRLPGRDAATLCYVREGQRDAGASGTDSACPRQAAGQGRRAQPIWSASYV
ncbi:hypothetical protein BV25DRAFT_172187 [Artomyces pyxidatus]|uniref:Uncharacterized protein n=1 Tax=Artomyces pyxidatus TaxID=48021 RepID=A0ACB8SGU2_9AGAM|nr:hypothetical protein BV25DRAFT_172187 [Artomyces pyxidatus]